MDQKGPFLHHSTCLTMTPLMSPGKSVALIGPRSVSPLCPVRAYSNWTEGTEGTEGTEIKVRSPPCPAKRAGDHSPAHMRRSSAELSRSITLYDSPRSIG